MKKQIYIFLLACSIFIFNACTAEQADLFPTSAAERMNNSLKDNRDILTHAENGWAMQYFPTDAKPGYTFLMKFKTNNFVTIAGKNEYIPKNVIKQDSSLYEMIADNGPVLTFNSYNEVFHVFSNPQNPNGYGLEGDYEFMILKSSENEIELKSKKRGVKIIMTKIPINMTWPQYFEELDTINAIILGNHPAPLKLNFSGSDYIFSDGATRIFSILKQGAEINTSVNASFIVTRSGIRFSTLQDIDGKKFQTMNLADDKSALICAEDNTLKLTGPDSLAFYFLNKTNEWVINPSLLSGKLKATYDAILQSAIDKYKAEKATLSIRYHSARSSFVLVLTLTAGKSKYIGFNDIYLTADGVNSLSTAPKGTGDRNGLVFYSNIAEFSQMMQWLSGSFNISTNTSVNPRNIKFQQKQDAEVWFTASRQ